MPPQLTYAQLHDLASGAEPAAAEGLLRERRVALRTQLPELERRTEALQKAFPDPTEHPTVMVTHPESGKPAPYGSYEYAQTMAPIWGMSPEQAFRLIAVESKQMDPEHAAVLNQLDELNKEG